MFFQECDSMSIEKGIPKFRDNVVFSCSGVSKGFTDQLKTNRKSRVFLK